MHLWAASLAVRTRVVRPKTRSGVLRHGSFVEDPLQARCDEPDLSKGDEPLAGMSGE